MQKSSILAIAIALALLGASARSQCTLEEFRLEASGAATKLNFGASVDVCGRIAVVGSGATNAGYVFEWDGTTWNQTAELTGATSIGTSVAVARDRVVLGAPLDDYSGPKTGSAWVFARSGSSWVLEARLVADDSTAGNHFGEFVDIDGDTICVGALRRTLGGPGAAYVFARSNSRWMQQAKLTASDGSPQNLFGSVALWGDTLAVGARQQQNPPLGADGATYVFDRSGTTWTESAKLTGGIESREFGRSVALDRDTLMVGSPAAGTLAYLGSHGAVYVFERDPSGWTQQPRLLPQSFQQTLPSPIFGWSVSLAGDHAVVGAPGDFACSQRGNTYVFSRTGSSWIQERLLAASVGSIPTKIAGDVATDGTTVLVGDPEADLSQGAVLVYPQLRPPLVTCTAKQNSLGCTPAIDSLGCASATRGRDFDVLAVNVLSQRPGVLLYGLQGAANAPLLGGTLCIALPLGRTPAAHSGGNPAGTDCSGRLAIDMNAFGSGALGGMPDPGLSTPGSSVHCQWWSRDGQSSFGSSLTDGLRYMVGP